MKFKQTQMEKPVAEKIAVVSEVVSTPAFAETVDTYGELKNKLAKKDADLKPLRDKVAELEGSLLSLADDFAPADEAITLDGEAFSVELSAKGRAVSAMDKGAIFDILGAELFMSLANFTVADLTRYLTGEQLEAVLTYENKNKRRVKAKAR